MKKIKLILISAIFLAVSCSEEQLITYQGETDGTSGIYFQRTASYTYGTPNVVYTDSTEYSFAGVSSEIQSGTVNVVVRTFGNISNTDRPFVISVVNDPAQTTAVEGVDFTVDYTKCVIEAGKSETYIPVTVMRSEQLTESSLRIKLTLEENEYFKFHITEYKANNVWNQSARMIDARYYVIRFTEISTTPRYWTLLGTKYFGTWTQRKYKVVNEVAGWTPADWSTAGQAGAKVALGRFDYVARMVQSYLQQMADNGTPVKDDDGSNMQMPSPYTVSYN